MSEETPRTKSILRCLYTSLALCIPVYLFTPGVFIQLILTAAFGTTVAILTHRERARLVQVETSSPTSLPILCKLPTIIGSFTIAALWLANLILSLVFLITKLGHVHAFMIVSLLFGSVQLPLLLAVGIMGILERKEVRSGGVAL